MSPVLTAQRDTSVVEDWRTLLVSLRKIASFVGNPAAILNAAPLQTSNLPSHRSAVRPNEPLDIRIKNRWGDATDDGLLTTDH